MTVKKLKEILKDLPDHMAVYVGKRTTEHSRGLINTAEVQKIIFYDEDDPENKDLQATVQAFVVSEEY